MLLKRKYLFGTTILAGVMAVTAPAFAQTTQLPAVSVQGQSDQDATEIGEVVVTGSRIRRDPTNAATPLIQVSRETLLETGQNTVIDYLATIPALSNSRVPSDTVDVFTQGVGLLGISSPNLRSLGAGRTLTLVDGRRHVGSIGGSLQVDVDTIPRLLIQNVEIVTGGASSIYGADAVSGVLNFVLRKDFEGLEIDLSAAQINKGGEDHRLNAAVLGGVNLFDDRLNLWGFAEYEKNDGIQSLDIDYYDQGWTLVGNDADPAASPYDNQIDALLFRNVRTLARPTWGQTTIANTTAPSPTNDPDIPASVCNTTSTTGYLNGNCYGVNPGFTYLFDQGPNVARLANFGQRLGNTGLSRPLNIGGDGVNPNGLTFDDRTPELVSQRYAAGANFKITPDITLSVDAKYVTEDSTATFQRNFFDFILADRSTELVMPRWVGLFGDGGLGARNFQIRYSDNAYLPLAVRNQITSNMIVNYNPPTATAAGTPLTAVAAPFARHSLFGPSRGQEQNRELMQYSAVLNGNYDQLFFVNNITWQLAYTYGEVENLSTEYGVDLQRIHLAADAVFDTAGLVNGRPGEIVCRSRLIAASPGALQVRDDLLGGDLRDSPTGRAALSGCQPLNIFGDGNQSAAALAYITKDQTGIFERNESEQAIGFVSGELWDFFGAGPIGIAIGAEHRREYTEASGRNTDPNLFTTGLTGPDFPGAEYKSDEYFAELSVPLFRDTWLGDYAELSGSYRKFDYTTAGEGDVYGVNLVYRPTSEFGFKTSFNTSFRAPNLGENFSPFSGTFSNGFVDPCSTASITGALSATYTAENRANRIANCTALAVARGYAPNFFDFAGTASPGTEDDFVQTVTSPFGNSGGNPALQPETSESFTFTTVYKPDWFPNFELVLDYYEIKIDNVIGAVSVNQAAALCVNGSGLSPACNTIFRQGPIPVLAPGASNIERSAGFQVAGPTSTAPAFIQGSVNFAKSETRGLDFTANYAYDAPAIFGIDPGSFRYSIRGNWLLDQKQFTNPSNKAIFTEFTGNVSSPRVRLTSQLTWIPTEDFSMTWTVDWQTAQQLFRYRDLVASNNLDNRDPSYWSTGNFDRHDVSFRYQLRDDLSIRGAVTNLFDNQQPDYASSGTGLIDNFDPYGRRFSIGLNYRPW